MVKSIVVTTKKLGLGEFNLPARYQVSGKLHYWNFHPGSSVTELIELPLSLVMGWIHSA